MDYTLLISYLNDPVIGKIILLFIFFIVISIAVKSLNRFVTVKIESNSSRYKFRKLINFLGFIALILVASSLYSDKLGKLTVAFGVAGAGIAFALQEVIVSIAGWFAINFSNFFKVGDRVMLGGIKGDVIDVGVLRTTLMEIGDWVNGDLYNGRTVLVSNSHVFKDPVFNYSAGYSFLWDEIVIPLHFSSDIKVAKELVESVAKIVVSSNEPAALEQWKGLVSKYMLEDSRISYFTSVTADENKISLTLRYVTDFKSRRTTKDQLFCQIIEKIKKSNSVVTWAYSSIEVSQAKL